MATNGASSPQAIEWNAAAAAAVECSRNIRLFVNESEAVLNRLHRALLYLQNQKFSDEKRILESAPSKEEVVHFLLVCVRNRFLAWRKVSYIKDLLTSSSQWSEAFRAHVASCPTCATVDLARGTVDPKPKDRLPIPFLLELLAACGVGLPLFAFALGCNCPVRIWMFLLGILLLAPLLAFESLWRRQRLRMLWSFAPGDYVVGATRVEVRCCWCPLRALLLEQGEASRKRGLMTFGEWWHKAPAPTANVQRAPTAYCGVSSSSGCESAGSSSPGEAGRLAINCAERGWSARAAILRAGGALEGLPSGGTFDGDAIVFERSGRSNAEPQVWAKLGWWRLGWMRRAMMLLAALGLLLSVVAAAFPPGVAFRCSPEIWHLTTLSPLDIFFVLDSSASIQPAGWSSEKAATAGMVDGFATAYGSQASLVKAGVAQFSTDTRLEISLTQDLAKVKAVVQAMTQDSGATYMANALKTCLMELGMHGGKAAHVCIMITDGEASDPEALPDVLHQLNASSIKLMGIYVGSEASMAAKLRNMVCSDSSEKACPWFARATNFAELRGRAADIAAEIASHSQGHSGDVMRTCSPPLGALLGLLLVLPALLWWLWLHFVFRPPPRPATRRDPQRLRAAGANEQSLATHPLSQGGQERSGCTVL